MTNTSTIREASINAEVKLYGLRKTKDGTVISFVWHPNDASDRLMTADIGDCFVMALVPIEEQK